jgi:hypothetical protein
MSIYRSAELLTWQLADWAAYGDREWGALKEFCEKHGMNYSTLKTYAYVARSVEMSRRLDQLSFAHHAEVAPLPSREQAAWLKKALGNNWSVAELRRRIRRGDQARPGSEGPKFIFDDKAVLQLHHTLTAKPSEYWNDNTRALWRDKLRPIVEFYQSTLCSADE